MKKLYVPRHRAPRIRKEIEPVLPFDLPRNWIDEIPGGIPEGSRLTEVMAMIPVGEGIQMLDRRWLPFAGRIGFQMKIRRPIGTAWEHRYADCGPGCRRIL